MFGWFGRRRPREIATCRGFQGLLTKRRTAKLGETRVFYMEAGLLGLPLSGGGTMALG